MQTFESRIDIDYFTTHKSKTQISDLKGEGAILRKVLKIKNKKLGVVAKDLNISRSKLSSLLKKTELPVLEKLAFINYLNLYDTNSFSLKLNPNNEGIFYKCDLSDFYNIPSEDRLNCFIKEYYNAIWKYVSQTNSTLFVVDYFGRNNPDYKSMHSLNTFFRIRGEYFSKLTKFMIRNFESNDYVYSRILVLPLNYFKNRSRPISLEEKIAVLLKLIYNESFEHLVKMFYYCMTKCTSCFNLYVKTNPKYLHSQIIIDNKVIIKEFEKYNHEMISTPDRITIEGPNNLESPSLKNSISYHSQDFNQSINSKETTEISLSDLITITNVELNKIKTHIKQLEKLIQFHVNQKVVEFIKHANSYFLNSKFHVSKNNTPEELFSLVNIQKRKKEKLFIIFNSKRKILDRILLNT